MKKRLIVLSGSLLALPLFSFAQSQGNQCYTNAQISPIEAVICRIGSILNTIIPILIVLGVVFFVYGVITYVIAGDEEAKTKGRDRIIAGIIGLVVIVGMWGLVRLVTGTFNLNNTTSSTGMLPPCITGTPGCP